MGELYPESLSSLEEHKWAEFEVATAGAEEELPAEEGAATAARPFVDVPAKRPQYSLVEGNSNWN